MKKTLLFIAIAFTTVFSSNAQTIWDFGNDVTNFPVSTGIGNGDGSAGNPTFPVIKNNLEITGISTNVNMGAVNASAKTFTDANSVSYSFANRFQFNGAGYSGAANTDVAPLVNMPTQRYLSLNVSGNSKIYFIGITGSSSSARKIFVTDGTNFIGSVDFPAATVLNDGTVNYTGPAAKLYIFCNAACNLYYLSATNVVITSVNKVLADKGVVFNGTEISNKNGLNLEIYDVLGKRVASSTTSISTTNFQKGIYIARVAGSNETLKFSK